MSEERDESLPELDANEIEDVVRGVNAVLGSIPGIGPLIAELVTGVIPRQRLDRVAEMVRILNQQLSDLRGDFVSERMLRPGPQTLCKRPCPRPRRRPGSAYRTSRPC